MIAKFSKVIEEQFPNLVKDKFLLACSGGVDSVVLAHLCAAAKLDFILAHCNFNLRGKASDEDEHFVKKLALTLGKEVLVQQFNTTDYAKENKLSIQMAARALRYTWFEGILLDFNLKTVVTAHHLDDDLETFIINLSRGTGIQGLNGMPSKTSKITRPLLSFKREEIVDYAQMNHLKWREDESNAETKYLRNKIRHKIVPLLKQLHPSFLENFKTTQNNLRETTYLNEMYISQLKEQLFVEGKGVIQIPIKSILKLEPLAPYLYGLFNAYGFTAWEDVSRLLTGMSGKEVLSKTHRLVKDRDYLLLTEVIPKNSDHYYIEEGEHGLNVPLPLKISEVGFLAQTAVNTLYVDKETLKFPLVLRRWEKGDYFYPLGMKGKKKLSKFFKDEKIDVISKEKQWLLCSENNIVWVIGKRADERFKVTSQTKNIIKIVLNK